MLQFIPVSNVKITDQMWVRKLSLVRDVVLPYMWEILNDRVENAVKSYCMANFRAAAGLSEAGFHGMVFTDSDLYKWIEAVSYCLMTERNEDLENKCDESIELIEAAQQSDGYLNTYFTIVAPEKRWTNLKEGHELYCAGHLIEAAVAYYKATGKDKLLNIALRFADHIQETFGETKRRGYPGHPEIELALIRLYDATGEEKYLELAEYFIDERGVGDDLFEAETRSEAYSQIFPEITHFKTDYFQSHAPVRQHKSAKGHAVRAMYLYSAMVDLARIRQDPELINACKNLFENVIQRQMYITGGIGAARLGERFTVDYDLPSESAYAETCASIGLMLFSSRMWLLNGKKENYDIWEQALYNTVLSGMGQDGQHFFYVNPLEVVPDAVHNNPSLSHVKTTRQRWFSVACCPPNLARILSSLPGYIYALDEDRLFITSHICSSFTKGGLYVDLTCKGETYTLTIDGNPRDVYLRIPQNTELHCDQCHTSQEGYFILHHEGGKKSYHYTLTPRVQIVRSHPKVSATSGKISVQRGSTVYCAEEIDNSAPLSSLRLPADAVFIEEKVDWLPDGIPLLKTKGFRVSKERWGDDLYNSQSYVYEPCEITLIPYSQWGNRGENEMSVWLTEITNNLNQ